VSTKVRGVDVPASRQRFQQCPTLLPANGTAVEHDERWPLRWAFRKVDHALWRLKLCFVQLHDAYLPSATITPILGAANRTSEGMMHDVGTLCKHQIRETMDNERETGASTFPRARDMLSAPCPSR
jgi:hypothetical protein